jgi:hypothetical protein
MIGEARGDGDDAMDAQTWERLAPVLDEVVGKLGETDRQSILLRYYEQKSFAEVGEALAIGEVAARKRVSRAVERMRGMLEGKGLAVSAGTLAAGLTSYTTQSAPASTAAGIATTFATPATASATVLTLARGALMRWTSLKIGFGVMVFVLGAIGISIAVAQVAGSNQRPAAPGRAATPAAATGPASKPVAAPAPAAVAAAATPKEVVEVAYRAGMAGDEDGLVRAFTGLTADQEVTVRRVARVMGAVSELQKAVAAEFGAEAAKQFGALASGVKASDVLEAPEKIDGNRAVVDLGPSGPGEVPLVRVGDSWKVSADVLRTLNVDSIVQWERKAPAIRKLAADITAGKYATPGDLQRAMGQLMR